MSDNKTRREQQEVQRLDHMLAKRREKVADAERKLADAKVRLERAKKFA